MLVTALNEHSLAGDRADADWRARIDAIEHQRPVGAQDIDAVAAGLGLAALLLRAPVLGQDAAKSRRTGASEAEHPKWRQVRTLLAKAESTDFGPEAEALVAKAQELVSRYALERLMESEDGRAGDDPGAGRQPVSRRLWLDRPYVRAKSVLVHEVAGVNHCRSALAERFGFVLLVGDAADLDAVDLLVTSLLMQAEVAMTRLGRSSGGAGRRARSRSFRQSFLLAYAQRIGERLGQAERTALAGRTAALPVLRDHDRRVAGAFETMVPHTVGRPVPVGDLAGYDAGIAAADLAVLGVHGRLSPGDT